VGTFANNKSHAAVGESVTSSAVLAVVLVPFLIRWTYTLANRPSDVKDKFRPSPPLRALYPGGLIMFGWAIAFEVSNLWHGDPNYIVGDTLGLVLGAGFLAMTILSWPIVFEVSEERLTWHHLLFSRHVPWQEVEDVSTDLKDGLVIYLINNRRIKVCPYIEGRKELKAFILKHVGRSDLTAFN
jgi:hypothetical protein